MDEDNDGRFSNDSLVEVRYPLTGWEQQGDRSAWPWLPGSILGQCRPDEWHVRVEAASWHAGQWQPSLRRDAVWRPVLPALLSGSQ